MSILDCCIVGGGISGILAGRILSGEGKKITILDKGRGRGGRFATRRIPNNKGYEAVFDYGAQYIQFQLPESEKLKNELAEKGIIQEWSIEAKPAVAPLTDDKSPFYIGKKGIRDITKYLSQEIDYKNNVKVTGFEYKNGEWRIECENNDTYFARSIILTPPVPQSLDLIKISGITLDSSIADKLKGIRYERSIALLLLPKEKTGLSSRCAVKPKKGPIKWISDNQAKGISDQPSLTIILNNEMSLNLWEDDPVRIAETIIDLAKEIVEFSVDSYSIHRWRYSIPFQALNDPYLYTDQPGMILFAGDALYTPGIEGAIKSGILAARKAVIELNR